LSRHQRSGPEAMSDDPEGARGVSPEGRVEGKRKNAGPRRRRIHPAGTDVSSPVSTDVEGGLAYRDIRRSPRREVAEAIRAPAFSECNWDSRPRFARLDLVCQGGYTRCGMSSGRIARLTITVPSRRRPAWIVSCPFRLPRKLSRLPLKTG
jgi:hypothetical protein